MDFENMNIWCWIIPALVGIICGILGYLIGKANTTTIDNSAELKTLKEKNYKLKTDLDACNKRVTAAATIKPTGTSANIKAATSSLGATAKSTSSSIASKVVDTGKSAGSSAASTASSFAAGAAAGASSGSAIAFDAAGAKAVYGKTIKQDDLKLVEGIGPKIEGMFKDDGIKTWKALSEASITACQAVLDKGGKRYQIHDPASWPLQAKMCYEGKWAELKKWQSEHKHGKL